MSVAVKRLIFAHDFLNPPSEDRSCDINLLLINSSGAISLSKQVAGIQTQYLLTVSNPSLIKLNSSDQIIVERAIKELTLAFNVCLSRICLSTLEGGLPSADVQMRPPETKVTVEQTPVGKEIRIIETMLIRGTVHITIGTSEKLDEGEALAILEKIISVDRFKLQQTSPIKLINLAKALNEYETAMSSFDRLRIFKNLFNTLEFSVNWDGADYTGQAFDGVVASISNIQQLDVGDWRSFYNRTKHVDRTPVDASQFVQGMEKLPSVLPLIREATKKLIVDRLNRPI
jgi:hypothetical protein